MHQLELAPVRPGTWSPPTRQDMYLAKARKIYVALIGCLMMQLLAFYHMVYTIRITEDHVAPLIYRVLAWTPLFLALYFLMVNPAISLRIPRHAGLILRGLLLVLLLSSLTGMATSYGSLLSRYFWGDLLRFGTPWLGFVLASAALNEMAERGQIRSLANITDALAVLAVIDALVTIHAGMTYFGWHISTSFFLYGVIWSIFQRRRGFHWSMLVFSLSTLACIVSSKRTNFVCLAVALAVSIAILFVKRRVSHIFSLGAILAFAGGTVFWFQSGDSSLVEHALHTLEAVQGILITGEGADNTMEFRDNEVRNVTEFFRDGNNFLWLPFGYGFGCEIPALYYDGIDFTPRGNMHHVHKGFWIYLLRNGILGVALLLGFCFYVVSAPWFSLKSPYWREVAMCLVFCSERVITIGAGNVMLEDLDLPLLAALCFAWIQASRTAPSPPAARIPAAHTPATAKPGPIPRPHLPPRGVYVR